MLSVCRPLESSHGRMNNGSNNLSSSSSSSSSQSQSNPERQGDNADPSAVDHENAMQFENSDESAEPMTITVRCDVCDMLFLNPSYLRKHLAEAHGMDGFSSSLQEKAKEELEEPDESMEGHPDRDVTTERIEQTELSSSVDISSDPTSQFLKAYADSVASLVCVYCALQLPSAEHLYLHMVQQHAPDMQANDPALQAQERWPVKGATRDTSSASSTSSSTSSALHLASATTAEDAKPQQAEMSCAPIADPIFRCNSCRRHFRAQRNLDAHKRKKHQHRTVSALLSADSSISAASNDALLGNAGGATAAQQDQQQQQQQQMAWTNLLAQNLMYQAAMSGQQAAPATAEQQSAYGQQQQAMSAAALGAYMPSVSDMTCAVCRQLTVLFQSHLLAAHSPTGGVIGQSSIYNAELTAALAASALLQQGSMHASNGQLVALDLSAKASSSSGDETGVGRGGAYCELCQKEFCNKYFLRTHKLNMHGIYSDDHHSPQTKQRTPVKQPCSGDVPPAVPPATSNGCASPSSGELETTVVADSDLFPPSTKQSRKAVSSEMGGESLTQVTHGRASQMTPSWAAPLIKEGATAGGSTLSCNLCVKSFPSFFALIAHRYRDHGSFDSSLVSPFISFGGSARVPAAPVGHMLPYGQELDNETVLCEICNREIASRYFLRFHLKNLHGIDPPDMAAALSLKMGSSRERQGRSASSGSSSSGVKNFCEICKKELCNKYFLRTHMLKMHGIVIDDHKVVIGSINNVDNGNGNNSTTTATSTATAAAAPSTTARSEAKRFQCCHCSEEVASTMELKTHFDQVHSVKATAGQNGPPQSTSRSCSEAPSGGEP